jgi:hypothetical protein
MSAIGQDRPDSTGNGAPNKLRRMLTVIYRVLCIVAAGIVGFVVAILCVGFYLKAAHVLVLDQFDLDKIFQRWMSFAGALTAIAAISKQFTAPFKQAWSWVRLRINEFSWWRFVLAWSAAVFALLLGLVGLDPPDKVDIDPVLAPPITVTCPLACPANDTLNPITRKLMQAKGPSHLPLVRFAPGRVLASTRDSLDFDQRAITLDARQRSVVGKFWSDLARVCGDGHQLKGTLIIYGFASNDPVLDTRGRAIRRETDPNLALANQRAAALAAALNEVINVEPSPVKAEPHSWQVLTDMKEKRDLMLETAGSGPSYAQDSRSATVSFDHVACEAAPNLVAATSGARTSRP